MGSIEAARDLLKSDKAVLERFYVELSGLETWLAFMGSLGQTEGSSSRDASPFTKRKGSAGCADQVIAKQAKMEELQASLHDVMAIPYEQGDRKAVERRMLYLDWDDVCQKAGAAKSCSECGGLCMCVFNMCLGTKPPV